MASVILASFIIMLASLAGVFVLWRSAGRFIEKHLSLLVSFSAGVFLVIALFLGNEVLFHGDSLGQGLLWIVLGGVGILLLFRFLPMFHHHHDESGHAHTHGKIDARRIMLSDALHNIGDGILIAASFAVSPAVGFLATLSIFIHELVQEVSEFFVLRQAGYSTSRALTLNFLVSSTILIGALGGFFLLDAFEMLELPLLGIAAGSFLVVVLHDLIPHSVRYSREKKSYLKYIVLFILGAALMTVVNMSLGHSHEHDDEHSAEHAHEHEEHDVHKEDHGDEFHDEHGHEEHSSDDDHSTPL